MCAEASPDILPEPPHKLKRLSDELTSLIRKEIANNGPLPFSDYMEMALYEAGLGYYSAGLQKLGPGGDFVTAPQLGDIFARCLATQVSQVAESLGEYEIIEAGAGTGILAADLLLALEAQTPPIRYRILERSAHLRQVQLETLTERAPHWLDRVAWLDTPPEKPWQGVLLANEVLDALTVERFCITADGLRLLQVKDGPDGFAWHEGTCPPKLRQKIEALLASLDEQPGMGFCSELNPDMTAWLDAFSSKLDRGLALFIDYGYTRRDYYAPYRNDGTLVCHYRHRVHSDPFQWPGLTDISTSVDFTALAEAADDCGLDVCGYTTQAMFLLSSGLDAIMADFASLTEAERLNMNNQVRRLTLPGEMGERFQVMALGRGLDEQLCAELRGFTAADLRYRL
jgi:SAM-dependent MidA family methyltransferase